MRLWQGLEFIETIEPTRENAKAMLQLWRRSRWAR
jgi:hypothetical protein